MGAGRLDQALDKLELESDLPKGKVSRRQVTSGYQRKPRQTGAANIYPNIPAFSFHLYSIWLSTFIHSVINMPTVPADQANMDQNLDNNALFNMSNIHHCLSVASCSIANCRCANFNADVNNTRYCDQCHHSWFSHEKFA
ncbi:Zinc finger protein basonuclin-2 [Trichinella pseudospiralis]|uniref:Zinc finger protein basonuclin-2 n=1 Tax=Trichinella pseudospiralis TaxID=6337 RepID=A0A0V1JQR5_TRIPS|nr:Zinc finger protein basonuclin-2 [Trichinella pseudospiralis]